MRAETLSWCRRETLFSAGDHVVCAVSGGADSMAMLWCLHSLQEELSIHVSAAHFNHGLRGQESKRDEMFVCSFCARYGIELTRGEADVRAYCAAQGMSEEDGARKLRYDFFDTLVCDHVATAHNADDNTETVLLHMMRGAGLRGLCGIPPKRGNIVRPVLWATRQQILIFLQEEEIEWIEDSSNSLDFCRRNRLRHWVLPSMREEEPAVSQRVAEMTSLLRGEDELLDDIASQLLTRAAAGEEDWDCQTILSEPDALQKRALRLMLRPHFPGDLSLVHIVALQQLLRAQSPSAQVFLPGGIIARREYETFTLVSQEFEQFEPVALRIPGVTRIERISIRIHCTQVEKFEKSQNTPFHFGIRYAMIENSIIFVRPRRSGDRIVLRSGNTATLKKLFIDRKIPRWDREQIPVFASGEDIIAVSGIGADKRYQPIEGEPALIIHIEKEEM